jgi:DNA-binding NarL/FixJ family response regulator
LKQSTIFQSAFFTEAVRPRTVKKRAHQRAVIVSKVFKNEEAWSAAIANPPLEFTRRDLTLRDRTVVEVAMSGALYKEASFRMGLSVNTLKTYMSNVAAKLGVPSTEVGKWGFTHIRPPFVVASDT